MEHKEGSSSSKRSSGSSSKRSSSRGTSSKKYKSSTTSSGGHHHREEVVKEAVASVIVNERSKYERKIVESTNRLTKYTAENDRLLDEVSNLRLQMREMKNDRAELVRAHHESMSLLAQVSEEKLVEFKSKSEQGAIESKAAQEEALRTVLEMMEKDCEDRVAELDNELARVEEDRERATRLQLEAAAKAAAEEQTKYDVEEAAKLAVSKLVQERASRDVEVQNLEEREKQLKMELELTKQRAELDKRAAAAAHAAAEAATMTSNNGMNNNNNGGGGVGVQSVHSGNSSFGGGGGGGDRSSDGSNNSHHSDYDSHSSGGHSNPYSEDDDGGEGGEGSSATGTSASSQMSPLIHSNPPHHPSQDDTTEPQYKRPPVIIHRRSMQRHTESPFLNDPLYEMTNGRKIALKIQELKGYQPVDPRGPGPGAHWDHEGLGLQSAWAYFEHSVLPRYIVKNPGDVGGGGGGPSSSSSTMDDLPGGGSGEDNGKLQRKSSNGSGRFKVYESDAGGDDDEDDETGFSETVSNAESDVDDWLYSDNKPKDKRPKRGGGGGKSSSGSGGGGGGGRGGGFRGQKGDLTRAEPGESQLPTRLYSPFFTPLSQLGDFGIGVGLYFSSLRAVAFITLIAGCINMPNILYFASEEYSGGQPGVTLLLRGSAICTEQVWVPCPTCRVEDFGHAMSRIAGATTVTPDGELQTLVFALKNACDGAKFQVGIVNMASLGFILLAIMALSLYQRKKQIAFDEQEQTAQDYSIEIYNPPGDATEPEEWKEFFESRFGGHLTCCTVTIDNDLLVKALAERREALFDIEEKLKEGATINTLTLSELAAKIEHGRHFFGRLKSRLSPGIPEMVGRLTVLNARIQGLTQQDYRATRVFCTFETEGAQRQVLAKMTVGSMAARKNSTHKINSNLLFRGEHVLLIREAEEPSTIRWMDLDEKWSTKIKQILLTTLISLGCTVGVAVIVALCRRRGSAFAALAISISNALFPTIAKALTNLESHASESGTQSSLYVKIAVFRWVVTAIVITIITPFTSTITNGPEHLLQSIYVIFFADLVTTNVLQLVDPVSNFKRHFLAPRAGSQERMNLLMGGTEYTIAERYTNMTKTLFLTFYYCAIYPSVFFLCALTLFVNFYVDKFSLLRTWKPAPMLGPYIAKFSRLYFMTTAIAALAVVSSYLFSGFPFDNLCAENVSHSAYYGNWKITDGEGQDRTAIIEPTVRSYHFCNQFLGPGSNFKFPALPDAQPPGSNWMTGEQEQLTGIYGWASVGVLGLVGLIFLYRLFRSIQNLFSASYKYCVNPFVIQPDGDVQGVTFSDNETISSYIPQVNSDHFTHPLLAVNIDYVDESIFDWSDPERSHSYYDLTRDADQLMKGNEDLCHRAFAQIRHWPPGGGGVSSMEEGETSTKSALRRSKDINSKRNNVSWSSKVTCKTYSKDDPNNYNNFNANASTSEGMNFNGHSDPLYDPYAQNEARVYKENVPNNDAANFDPYGPNNGHFENNGHDQQTQQNQTPLDPNQHFDPYYNTGLDYANQPPDPMYGDSQNQDAVYEDVQNQDGASWEGSAGAGSYERSGSSGTSGSYSNSDNSASSGTDSYSHSDASAQSYSPSASNQQQCPNDGNAEFMDEEGSGGSDTYDESAGSSRGSSNTSSGSIYSQPPADQQEFYEEEVFEDDQNWENGDGQEAGSYSTGSSASEGLPPVT
ncbi:hypothetical protein ACHAXR_009091 [Thalassiosira sp. AJA248-18]